MKLSNLAKKKILGERKNIVIGKLMSTFNAGERTVEKWVEKGNAILTTPTAVEIIKSETNLSESEIIEKD